MNGAHVASACYEDYKNLRALVKGKMQKNCIILNVFWFFWLGELRPPSPSTLMALDMCDLRRIWSVDGSHNFVMGCLKWLSESLRGAGMNPSQGYFKMLL